MDKVFALLKAERGGHFDPELVDLFFSQMDPILRVRERWNDRAQ
jgi:response regulator RpfG family c-di-GMP phosphodiesterase